MSAFIVSSKTINTIVTFTERHARRSQGSEFSLSYACCDFLGKAGEAMILDGERDLDAATLGKALYDLNVRAVSARYPHEPVSSLPGPIDAGYQYRAGMPCAPIAVVKALDCLLYQCSEGDVPNTPLYQALEQFRNALAHAIVAGLPEYERAPWA